MIRSIFKEQLKRADPILQAARQSMWEHPLSLEEMREQVKRNKEIRRQNMLASQQKGH